MSGATGDGSGDEGSLAQAAGPEGGLPHDADGPSPLPGTRQQEASGAEVDAARAEMEALAPGHPESSPLGSLAIVRRLLLPFGHQQRLVINPLVADRQLGTTTIDLRLGTEWEAMRSYRFGSLDPGEDPDVANELLRNGVDEFRLTAGQREGIVLHPGELLLALTLEYLKLPADLWGVLEGRSTWARQGLQVHATAGMVDAGFEGYLTLELQNTGRIPLVLYPGLRLAQMAFHPITMTAYAYNSKPHAGYSGQARARSRFVEESEHRARYAYVRSQADAEPSRSAAGQEPLSQGAPDLEVAPEADPTSLDGSRGQHEYASSEAAVAASSSESPPAHGEQDVVSGPPDAEGGSERSAAEPAPAGAATVQNPSPVDEPGLGPARVDLEDPDARQ